MFVRTAFWGYAILLTYLVLVPSPLWFLGDGTVDVDAEIDAQLPDYVQHITAYAVFSILAVASDGWRLTGRVFRLLVFVAMHGVVAETCHAFIPGRCFGVLDGVANFLGMGVGLVASLCVGKLLARP